MIASDDKKIENTPKHTKTIKTKNNLTFNSYLQNNGKTQKQPENIKTQKDLNLSLYSQENTKTQKDQLKNDEREVLPHMKSVRQKFPIDNFVSMEKMTECLRD